MKSVVSRSIYVTVASLLAGVALLAADNVKSPAPSATTVKRLRPDRLVPTAGSIQPVSVNLTIDGGNIPVRIWVSPCHTDSGSKGAVAYLALVAKGIFFQGNPLSPVQSLESQLVLAGDTIQIKFHDLLADDSTRIVMDKLLAEGQFSALKDSEATQFSEPNFASPLTVTLQDNSGCLLTAPRTLVLAQRRPVVDFVVDERMAQLSPDQLLVHLSAYTEVKTESIDAELRAQALKDVTIKAVQQLASKLGATKLVVYTGGTAEGRERVKGALRGFLSLQIRLRHPNAAPPALLEQLASRLIDHLLSEEEDPGQTVLKAVITDHRLIALSVDEYDELLSSDDNHVESRILKHLENHDSFEGETSGSYGIASGSLALGTSNSNINISDEARLARRQLREGFKGKGKRMSGVCLDLASDVDLTSLEKVVVDFGTWDYAEERFECRISLDRLEPMPAVAAPERFVGGWRVEINQRGERRFALVKSLNSRLTLTSSDGRTASLVPDQEGRFVVWGVGARYMSDGSIYFDDGMRWLSHQACAESVRFHENGSECRRDVLLAEDGGLYIQNGAQQLHLKWNPTHPGLGSGDAKGFEMRTGVVLYTPKGFASFHSGSPGNHHGSYLEDLERAER